MLLTRAPLYRGLLPFSFDLHVLSAPLTFVLSQDQTLQLNLEIKLSPRLRGRACLACSVVAGPKPLATIDSCLAGWVASVGTEPTSM